MSIFTKTIELRGHIIDSLTFPKVLDEILEHGAEYETEEIVIGKTRQDQSYARIRISAPSEEVLQRVLNSTQRLGALIQEEQEVRLVPAPGKGFFPQGFYATTNLPTSVNFGGRWREVEELCMDSGIKVLPPEGRAICIKMYQVKAGDLMVVGHEGVKVQPLPKKPAGRGLFEFMSSTVSPEKSKELIIQEIAREMKNIQAAAKGKILWVLGPALVHTGARDSFCQLIQAGYVDVVFAGNGLAVHDVEVSLFGTSLGVSLDAGKILPRGHENHLRTINFLRSLGGIQKAIELKHLQTGIMYHLHQAGIPYVLAGSIRDDGPLLEVITDTVEAQKKMRELCRGVSMALMVASMLHSIATGNLLPAEVRTICVDINTEMVTKLADRGTHQSLGLVTDAELFLRELARYLCG